MECCYGENGQDKDGDAPQADEQEGQRHVKIEGEEAQSLRVLANDMGSATKKNAGKREQKYTPECVEIQAQQAGAHLKPGAS